jgi:hypothetical protein
MREKDYAAGYYHSAICNHENGTMEKANYLLLGKNNFRELAMRCIGIIDAERNSA